MIQVEFQGLSLYFLKNIRKYADEYGYKNIIDIVIYSLITKNRNTQMAMPSDRSIIANLRNVNAYSMKLTRWLLEKIENIGNTAEVNMTDLSIEHIMPQTSNKYWNEKARVTGEDYLELVNKIGNLTLVSKIDNSIAGNKNFEAKKIFLKTLDTSK